MLDVEHVIGEVSRVYDRRGATLLLGRVRRNKDSMKVQMRNKMRELLVEEGAEPRPAERNRQQLLELCLAGGGRRVEPLEAARWQTRHRPIDSIEAWRDKQSMAGITPPADTKEMVLTRLAEWAAETFGDLEAEFVSEERYVVEGTRFSASTGDLT